MTKKELIKRLNRQKQTIKNLQKKADKLADVEKKSQAILDDLTIAEDKLKTANETLENERSDNSLVRQDYFRINNENDLRKEIISLHKEVMENKQRPYINNYTNGISNGTTSTTSSTIHSM